MPSTPGLSQVTWGSAVNAQLDGDSGPVDVATTVHGQHDEVVSSVSAWGTLGVFSTKREGRLCDPSSDHGP